MATLLVFRGDSVEREVELAGGTLRLGRSSDKGVNDVVLEDPTKSVSRAHAEIRFEGGRYVLVDLQSQNGIWVSESRVPYVVLEPGVVARIGPYRLVLQLPGAAADEGAGRGAGVADDDQTNPGGRSLEGLQFAEPAPPQPPPSGGAAIPRAAPQAGWLARQPKWRLAAGSVVVVGALAAGAVSLMQLSGGQAGGGGDEVTKRLDAAEALIAGGECGRALAEQIDPILASAPANPRALELRARAEKCEPVKKEGPMSAEEMATHLAAASSMIDTGDCATALSQHIGPVLDVAPTNSEAVVLRAKADACIAKGKGGGAVPGDVKGPCGDVRVAKRIEPANGGLALASQCESQESYAARVATMTGRYDSALKLLAAQDYKRAIDGLEAVARDATPAYRDVTAQLARARSGQKTAARRAFDDAKKQDAADDWENALANYERAHELDPSIDVQQDVARLAEKKTAAGKKACDAANARFAYGRNAEALKLYRDALRLLPPDDPCYAIARERVASLGK